MRRIALIACAGLACAQAAFGQAFRLDLSLTARRISPGTDANGNPTTVLTDNLGSTNGVVFASPCATYLFELRYRIADLVQDTTGSIGLHSAKIIISVNNGSGTVHRFALTNFLQSGTDVNGNPVAVPALNPDNSGQGSGVTGLNNAFRGGLVTDADAANGFPDPNSDPQSFDIQPLALSAPISPTAQKSFNGTNPTSSNTNNNTWAIYDFLYTTPSAFVAFTASAVADPQTGIRFSYFRRQGSTDDPNPQFSFASTPCSISFAAAYFAPCCWGDQFCTHLSDTDCLNAGGSPGVYGSDCCPIPCEPPGACCMGSLYGCPPTGSTCTMLTNTQCQAHGGMWQGVQPCQSPDHNYVPCCSANFDHQNGVTVQDVFSFLTAWFAQLGTSGANPPLTADFDCNGTVRVNDLFQFLAAYFARCG